MDDAEMKKTIEHFLGLYGRGRWNDPGDPVPLDEILDMLTDDVERWISRRPGFMKKDEFRWPLH